MPIYQMLQGFMEVGKNNTVTHLLAGEWYVLEPNYTDILSKEYGEFFDVTYGRGNTLKKKFWPLAHDSISEDDYNLKYFVNSSKIIVSHTVLMDNIELADAIFCDQDNVYLLHNKRKFDGMGTRDLTNQILGASEYFQQKFN